MVIKRIHAITITSLYPLTGIKILYDRLYQPHFIGLQKLNKTYQVFFLLCFDTPTHTHVCVHVYVQFSLTHVYIVIQLTTQLSTSIIVTKSKNHLNFQKFYFVTHFLFLTIQDVKPHLKFSTVTSRVETGTSLRFRILLLTNKLCLYQS